jgi:hypothetical protein
MLRSDPRGEEIGGFPAAVNAARAGIRLLSQTILCCVYYPIWMKDI